MPQNSPSAPHSFSFDFLTFIARQTSRPEELITNGLHFLLQKHSHIREAFCALVCGSPTSPLVFEPFVRLTGSVPGEKDAVHFCGIPDLVGFDGVGQGRLLVELKVEAAFTELQLLGPENPAAYQNLLPRDGKGGTIAFIVPERRVAGTLEKILVGARAAYNLSSKDNSGSKDNPGSKELQWTEKDSGHVKHLLLPEEKQLSVLSWRHLIEVLESSVRSIAAQGEAETEERQAQYCRARLEVDQFKALALAVLGEEESKSQWMPLAPLHLSAEIGRALVQIIRVIDASLADVASRGLGVVGASASGPPFWGGRYLKYYTVPLLDRLPLDAGVPVPSPNLNPCPSDGNGEDALSARGSDPGLTNGRTDETAVDDLDSDLDTHFDAEPVRSPRRTTRNLLLFISAHFWAREAAAGEFPLWAEVMCTRSERRLMHAQLRLRLGAPGTTIRETEDGFLINVPVPANTSEPETIKQVVSRLQAIIQAA